MCLIIANPNGSNVPAEFVINAYSQNSDGFGVMYSKNGQLRVKRGLFPIAHILDIFADLNAAKRPYVAHFRYATHGTTNSKNCHPFPVTTHLGGVAMVHNGTLTGNEWRSPAKSDTALLVGRLQRHIEKKDFRANDLFDKDVPEVHNRYTKAIGTDKLVFMNGKEQINIYNEENGVWLDDVWYSNLYSLCRDRVSVSSWRRGAWKAEQTDSSPIDLPKAPRLAAE